MSEKKFWVTTVTVEVLTFDEEAPNFRSLEQIHHAITEGDASGRRRIESKNVLRAEFEQLVEEHGSDMSFFIMDDDDYSVKRIGTPHEEDVINDRARCKICGWIDEADINNPTVKEWHGDSFQ